MSTGGFHQPDVSPCSSSQSFPSMTVTSVTVLIILQNNLTILHSTIFTSGKVKGLGCQSILFVLSFWILLTSVLGTNLSYKTISSDPQLTLREGSTALHAAAAWGSVSE